jgi:hypothetical protein
LGKSEKRSISILTEYAPKGRAWEQRIAILNQARAYNYFIDCGCSGVRFVARVKNQKTPDLTAELIGQKVLFEVKTINPSEQKLAIRLAGDADSTRAFLDDDFFRKLDSTIAGAKCQMLAYDRDDAVKRFVFIVITFDDQYGEYDSNYYAQIDQHFLAPTNDGLEIVFSIGEQPFTRIFRCSALTSSMSNY